jgi:hypothetical protein
MGQACQLREKMLINEYITLLSVEELSSISGEMAGILKNSDIELDPQTRKAILAVMKTVCHEVFMRINPSKPEIMKKIWEEVEQKFHGASRGVQ